MMRFWFSTQRMLTALCCFLSIFLVNSCISSEGFGTRPRDDFESLWRTIDRHYCFFDFKHKEYGLDWNEVHERYRKQISDSMSPQALFQVLGKMCSELRDGHVNLWSPQNTARYTRWYEAYPMNFSDSLLRRALGSSDEYRLASGMQYKIFDDNVGYLRCASFDMALGAGNLHEIMRYLSTCDGLIVDVRNNGGGYLTSAETLAAVFTNEEKVVGYISHKTGPGHSDFSTPKPIVLQPGKGLRWQKPVVVLANRRTYSAANAFVMYMKALPNVTFMGDQTGGGSGLPFSSELPGGWSIRFSASPIYNAKMQHTEFGIKPDIAVGITRKDYQQGVDTMLESAKAFLKKQKQ